MNQANCYMRARPPANNQAMHANVILYFKAANATQGVCHAHFYKIALGLSLKYMLLT